jgi:hypothetical protein
MKRNILNWLLSLSLATPAFAASTSSSEDIQEPRIPFWSIITDFPDTAWYGMKFAVRKEQLPMWGVVAGSTVVLYHYDSDILNDVQTKGRSWGLGNSVNYDSWLKLGDMTLFSGPKDTAGWLYFLGDGTIPVFLSLGMIGTGYWGDKNRAWNTGLEMGNALIVGGVFDQILKRTIGRESPSFSGGRDKWRPFPNLKRYARETSRYDAMPSGHIMSATIMFTVLEQEYSEYNYIFYPAEVAWLGVLGFGMVNVGVHWASDYPLGIALGYLFGRSAVAIHHPERDKTFSSWQFMPDIDEATGVPLISAVHHW